ncbi:MAG TPA: YrdB family protein [Solirubrobacterales bacterium]|nr:YrdB family protein [Solirubrobacterales bacterium]
MIKPANLALKFLLELAAFAAFAVWGADAGSGASAVILAIAAPLVAVLLWGRFAAPRSARRLPRSARIPFELGVFLLAALALLAAGHIVTAAVFAALVALNALGLTAFDQWEG